jgi:hypothetical protein
MHQEYSLWNCSEQYFRDARSQADHDTPRHIGYQRCAHSNRSFFAIHLIPAHGRSAE